MLVYLSKKIAIPNQVKLNCISWNRDQGWISCGGDGGLLKVLKLESAVESSAAKGIAAASNLSMNQTLEGHTGGVICATWNPLFRKLTTSDESGLIIVWMFHKGLWYEEMINNRNKSVVRDMKWTSDGKKICIVYEDGAVIVGSVDGNRLWGKELNMPLRFIEWSPDNRQIIFVTTESEVWIYDSEGNRLRQMSLSMLDVESSGDIALAGLAWHSLDGSNRATAGSINHYTHADSQPSLCIALTNGMIVLCRGDEDKHPVVINTEMSIKCCKWDSKGSIIALTGHSLISKSSSNKESKGGINQIKFFDCWGKHLRTTRIPGEQIADICWESSGLRLALAVDSYIFFANVRPQYIWAYIGNTVIYSYSKPDRRETILSFWDLTTMESIFKVVAGLKFIVSSADMCCVIVSESEDSKGSNTASSPLGNSTAVQDPKGKKSQVYTMQLRNAIGAIIDSKTIPFTPKYVSMGPSHVVVCNDRTVYTWQFQAYTASKVSSVYKDIATQSDSMASEQQQQQTSKGKSRERIFDVESTELTSAQAPENFKVQTNMIVDPITCTTIDDKFLLVARSTGSITRYTLPHLSVENTYNSQVEPFHMSLNCTSSRLAIIDSAGVLSVLDLDAKVVDNGSVGNSGSRSIEEEKGSNGNNSVVAVGKFYGKKLSIEKRDVWDLKWAEDNDEMLCVMEKTKIIVYRNEVAEEPIISSGYIARFKDLEIRSVLLDDLVMKPDTPTKDVIVDHETKGLREVRDRIAAEGLQGGYTYADKQSHPHLWKLLAHAALEDLDFNMAERAFVRCSDYYGIQLVKQLQGMPDKMKARAEVAVYMKKFDEAENIYREIDRKDLAIQMRRKIGDDARVVQLLQTGGGNDALVSDAWNRIGDFYADRFKWTKAVTYFQQSRDVDKLIDCYYRTGDYDNLKRLSGTIADGSQSLVTLAHRFESIGMYEDAVDCHLRNGNPKAAVDCCVTQNRWGKALELAEQNDFPQVEGLLTRYAMQLVSSGRQIEAVELYRRANKPTEAAMLISDIADTAAKIDVKPSLAKKLHVLSALEVERHRKRTMDLATQATMKGTTGLAQTTAATLETLMMTSLDTQTTGNGMTAGTTQLGGTNKKSKAFSNAWRGAAAYHYFMLAHRQLYSGNSDAAMRTAIKICEYDDVLDPRSCYSLLAVSSMRAKFYGICSKAFVKLETLTVEGISVGTKDEIQTLAVNIFIKNSPVDPAPLPDVYIKCLELGKTYKACVATGKAIIESPAHTCRTCRHLILETEKSNYVNCPLCHTSFTAPIATSASSLVSNNVSTLGTVIPV